MHDTKRDLKRNYWLLFKSLVPLLLYDLVDHLIVSRWMVFCRSAKLSG